MTLLLDTCAFIWLAQEPEKLSANARIAINDPGNTLPLSHVSAREIHLKHHAGKLMLPEPPRQWIRQQLAAWSISEAAIHLNAIHRTSDLPDLHRDPFDRLLVAQAQEEGFRIVSPDRSFAGYGVAMIW